ncbi:hypothetical protein HNV12_08555 [Methanococcoides sp. SA1]|nr:hypothetical protein [Methanococcoides sp. SA1]
MKLKLLLGLLIVVGMIGLGSATEDKESDSGRTLTPEEVDEMYPTWIMPDHMRAEFDKETPESIEKKRLLEERLRQNMIKKPLTPEEIAERNANAPEGMFLVSGIEDVSMNRVPSENARVEGDKIVMNWAISAHSLNSNLTNNSATVFVPNVLEVLRETGIRIGMQVQTTRS